jgi:F-type H+-transporting ATPase subunit b
MSKQSNADAAAAAHGSPVEAAAGTAVPGEHEGGAGPVRIDGPMMGLTWITFGLLCLVLYKAAWKPILAGLERREENIRKSLEDAEKARQELARVDEQRKQIIGEADEKAKGIVDHARQAATDAAAAITDKARDEARISLENAQREIRGEQEKAMAALRRDSADIAITLARRILGEQLDEARGRAVTDRVIQEI